jgi:hypothetical protein
MFQNAIESMLKLWLDLEVTIYSHRHTGATELNEINLPYHVCLPGQNTKYDI